MMEIAKLIESEICDFFAGFGHPGEPETPEEMQSQLLARVMPLLAGLEQESVADVVAWHHPTEERNCDIRLRRHDLAPGPPYAAPQLPQPAVVPLAVSWEDVPEEITEDDMGLASAWAHGFNQCRAAMLQGAEPVQATALRDGLEAIRNSGIAIDAEKILAERDALNCPVIPDDVRRMDWLVSKTIDVREPMVYGSHSLFWSQTITDEEDDYHATKLREQIDAAMATERAAAPQQEVKSALEMGMARYGDAMQKLADGGD